MREISTKIRSKKNARGTALLTAILIMGILTAVSLGVSSLIVREMGVTRLAVDAGRAYYAAESGVELALLQLDENLPGFEWSSSNDPVELGSGVSFDWEIMNLASEYPYLDEENEYDITDAPISVNYGVLELNQSVTIPLFVATETGEVKKVDKFLVQFYVGFNKDNLGVDIDPSYLTGWDILRWKIYGLTAGVESGMTESINDFTAVSFLIQGGEETQTNAEIPSWFGSHECSEFGLPEGVECATYENQSHPFFETIKTVSESGGELSQDVYAGTCLPTEAREHYSYDAGSGAQVVHCYKISEFLTKHNYNYLSLTNLMNPLVFREGYSEEEKLRLSKLYYRIQLGEGDELVREFANITSVGESGDSKIKLSVLRKRDSVLPVFNFALYHME